MAIERTLSIVKPNAVRENIIGEVYSRLEAAGLSIVAARMMLMTPQLAEAFYEEHRDKKFFGELVDFMVSGPVVVQVLEGENAIARNREIMGPTDPMDAPAGTIRGDLAKTRDENTVHGSDSPEAAAREIKLFFDDSEIFPR